jgi:hypothetical protein
VTSSSFTKRKFINLRSFGILRSGEW